MVHTRQKNGGSTCIKLGLVASTKSQKFVTPQKFHGNWLKIIEHLTIFHIFIHNA
jgi:hypothetical protein